MTTANKNKKATSAAKTTSPTSSAKNIDKTDNNIQNLKPKFLCYNDGSSYNWSQTSTQVIFSLLIPKTTITQTDIKVTINTDSVTACIIPESLPRLHGKLMGPIKPAQSLWTVEDLPPLAPGVPNRYRVLVLTLTKSYPNQTWALPIRAVHPMEIMEFTTDPHSLYLLASACHDLSDPGALQAMKEAAEKGSVSAMLKLAAWYELGKEEMASIPVDKDPTESLKWHMKAATVGGNAEACYIVMSGI